MNNAWTTNAVLQIMKGENKWYKPDKRGDDHTPAQSTAAPTEPDFVSPGTFSDAVNRMFSPGYYKYWEEFCSTRWYSEDHNTYPPMGYLSLEYIHNNVHVSLCSVASVSTWTKICYRISLVEMNGVSGWATWATSRWRRSILSSGCITGQSPRPLGRSILRLWLTIT